MRSLPSHFRSPKITWRHFLPSGCLVLRATGLYSVKCTVYASFGPSTSTSRWLEVKWSPLQVTSGHLRSRNIISCEVTASYYELQRCRKWNVHCTQVFSFLQPLPGDFRSNDVTSGSLPVTWGHVTTFPITWLPNTAIYSLVGNETYSKSKFLAYSHFHVTSGQMTSLPGHLTTDVTWRHFPSRDCLLLRATALLEVKCTV